MGNDISKKKSEQIINYYIFHKKIDNIIKKGINLLNAQRNEISIYILNLEWIKKWKLYTNYEVVQKELDNINDNDENSLYTKLNERCEILIKNDTINNSTDYQPGNDEEYNLLDFGNKVLDLQFFNEEFWEALVDEKTFTSFFGIFEQIFNFKNIVYITGIIKSEILILMMKQNKKMKLFYYGDMENKINLIQLTAKFPNETIFDKYCQYYKSKTSKTIINRLNGMNVGYEKEKETDDYCIFTNESLNKIYLIDYIRNNSINFKYIRDNFMGLDNISSPPYLNAVIQNIVNIPSLITYLMDESNFALIDKNKNVCNFTCFICRILSNLYYDRNITSFNLNYLNEFIYFKKSKFKFDENCIPGELIKYILETLDEEFIKLFSILAQKSNNRVFNSTIISNTFLCEIRNISKCNSCQNKKADYSNKFLFDFHLDVIYNRYIDTMDMIKRNGKYILTLELCFKFFNEPIALNGDYFCDKCKKITELEKKEDLFKLPNVLIISVNKESDINNKYDFSFPEELNLKNFINNRSRIINYKYNLIGIISHKESRKEYCAFCKHSLSNKWYKCKDLSIDICYNPIKELLSQNVDVLIYESLGGSTDSKNIRDIINEKKI